MDARTRNVSTAAGGHWSPEPNDSDLWLKVATLNTIAVDDDRVFGSIDGESEDDRISVESYWGACDEVMSAE